MMSNLIQPKGIFIRVYLCIHFFMYSFSDNYNKRVTDNLKFQISSEFSGKFKDAQISSINDNACIVFYIYCRMYLQIL